MRFMTTLILVLAALIATARAQTLMQESFGSASMGWTTTGSWQIASAVAGTAMPGTCGSGLPDPAEDSRGLVGEGIAGTNIGGLLPPTGGVFEYLTSPVIPGAACTPDLHVSFGRFLNIAGQVTATFEVFDGTTWQVVDSYDGGVFATTEWRRRRYDISTLANPNLQLRFGVSTAGGYSGNCAGYCIDSVRVYSKGIFHESFDDNSLGWIMNGMMLFEIGPAMAGGSSGGGTGNADPGFDADRLEAGGVAGTVIGGDMPLGIFNHRLESPVIDLTGVVAPTLDFDRWLNISNNEPNIAQVYAFDGSFWNVVWANPAGGPMDSRWVDQAFDLTPYKNSAFRLLFEMDSASVPVSGWNVDNVCIYDSAVGAVPVAGVATLDVNDATECTSGATISSGLPGPYFSEVSVGADTFVMSFGGAPNQAIVLMSGPLQAGVNDLAPFGQLDIGTPGFGALDVLASGLDPGILNNLFITNGAGQQAVGFQLPSLLIGTDVSLQALITHPTFAVVTTNAVHVDFLP